MENRVSLRNLIYQAMNTWEYSAWKKYQGKQLQKDNLEQTKV